MTGRTEIYEGVSVLSPNDTFRLKDEGFYVSYNNVHNNIYGCDTTALVREKLGNPTKFLILNGNHTKEYRALGTYDACVEYFKSHSDQQNKFSENWDEEFVFRRDGKSFVRKIT